MCYLDSIPLLDGTCLKRNENGAWPALQDVKRVRDACEICPVRKYCGDNNEFDCQVYAMFCGFYLVDEFTDEFLTRWNVDPVLCRSQNVPAVEQ